MTEDPNKNSSDNILKFDRNKIPSVQIDNINEEIFNIRSQIVCLETKLRNDDPRGVERMDLLSEIKERNERLEDLNLQKSLVQKERNKYVYEGPVLKDSAEYIERQIELLLIQKKETEDDLKSLGDIKSVILENRYNKILEKIKEWEGRLKFLKQNNEK